MKFVFVLCGYLICSFAQAASCYQSSILSPAPFLGVHDEHFKLSDGSTWKVQFDYEYLYEYHPNVTICPASGKLLVNGKKINVVQVTGGKRGRVNGTAAVVVFKRSGCRGYFLADGDTGGIYLLEHYGGYEPIEGDLIAGLNIGYGIKQVVYPNSNSDGRVYVDDFMLSKDRAIEKIREKCR